MSIGPSQSQFRPRRLRFVHGKVDERAIRRTQSESNRTLVSEYASLVQRRLCRTRMPPLKKIMFRLSLLLVLLSPSIVCLGFSRRLRCVFIQTSFDANPQPIRVGGRAEGDFLGVRDRHPEKHRARDPPQSGRENRQNACIRNAAPLGTKVRSESDLGILHVQQLF